MATVIDQDRLFQALGDATRRRTLAILRRHELAVGELVDTLQLPQSTVSRHLKVLREAGLIRDRRNGTTALYSVRPFSNDGDADGLPSRALEWLGGQSLPPAIERRLASIIRRRGEMSRQFFSRIADRWDALREESFGEVFHLEALLALAPHGWTVADLGTGTGYLLPMLAGHFARVVAVEPVEQMREAARQRITRLGLTNVDLRGGELAWLPIADDSVDAAIATLVLHHVAEPRDAIREIARIVRPGGRVLIVEQVTHRQDAFRDRMQDRWWGFEPAEIREALASVDLVDSWYRLLSTVDGAPDAPSLFVITADKRPRTTPAGPATT